MDLNNQAPLSLNGLNEISTDIFYTPSLFVDRIYPYQESNIQIDGNINFNYNTVFNSNVEIGTQPLDQYVRNQINVSGALIYNSTTGLIDGLHVNNVSKTVILTLDSTNILSGQINGGISQSLILYCNYSQSHPDGSKVLSIFPSGSEVIVSTTINGFSTLEIAEFEIYQSTLNNSVFIPAGFYNLNIFADCDNDNDKVAIFSRIYHKEYLTSSETMIGQSEKLNVNSLSPLQFDLTMLNETQRQFNVNDSFVLKIFAESLVNSSHTLRTYYQGQIHYTHIHTQFNALNSFQFNYPLYNDGLNNISLYQVSSTTDGYLSSIQYNSLLAIEGSKWKFSGNDIYNSNTGNVIIRNDLIVSGNEIISSNLNVSGTGQIIGAVNFQSSLNVAGPVVQSSTLIVSGAVNFQSSLTILGPIIHSGSLTILGAVNFQSSLNVAGPVRNSNTLINNGAVNFESTLNIRGLQTNSGGVIIYGNTGIGITTPDNQLDVLNAIGVRNSLGMLRLTTSGGTNFIQSGASYTSDSKAPLVFGSIFAGTEWMRITSTGNVGIGTNNPAYKLDVNGLIGGQGLIVENSGYAQVELGGANGGYIDFKAPFSDDYDYRFIYDSVNSFREASQDSTGRMKSLEQFYNDNGVFSQRRIRIGQTNFRQFLQSELFSGTWQNSDFLMNPNGGNVGIGTNNPAYKLDVNGDIEGKSLIFTASGSYVVGSIYRDANWGCIVRTGINNPTIANFSIADFNDSHLFTINPSGLIGINNTNPLARLHVSDATNTNNDRIIFGANVFPIGSAYSLADIQCRLLGNYNIGYNGTNSNTSIKLFIGSYSNDGEIVYPLLCEDENGSTDFYVRAQDLATGFENRNYFRGQLAIGRNNFSSSTTAPYRLSIRQVRMDATITPTYLMDFRGIDNYGVNCMGSVVANRGSMIHFQGDDYNNGGTIINNRPLLSIYPTGSVQCGVPILTDRGYQLYVNAQANGYGFAIGASNDSYRMGSYINTASPIPLQFGSITNHRFGLFCNNGSPIFYLDPLLPSIVSANQHTFQSIIYAVGPNARIFNNAVAGGGVPLNMDTNTYEYTVGVSSIKYKENVRKIDDIRKKIFQIEPVIFDWKDNASVDIQMKFNQFGFIAEQVKEYFPQHVPSIIVRNKLCDSCSECLKCSCDGIIDETTGKCGCGGHEMCSCTNTEETSLTIDYSRFVPLCISGLQNLYNETDKLKEDNEQFKVQINELKEENEQLKVQIAEMNDKLNDVIAKLKDKFII